ncbi:sugar phosphate isomerase/epimerase family protein [Candidatus Latescibacterota bacterium]
MWGKQIKPDPQPLRPLLEAAVAEGYGMVEWRSPTRDGITVPASDLLERPEAAVQIRELGQELGLGLSYHAPQGPSWQFGVLAPELAESRLRECVRRAASIGARLVTLHLGVAVGEGRDSSIRQGARICQCVAQYAEDHGIQLSIENVYEEHSVATVSECQLLFECADDPRIGLTLDTGHAHLCGCLHEMARCLPDRLAFTHIHDNDLTDDVHLAPGHGTIDWPLLIADLEAASYTGPLSFELREEARLCDLIATWRHSR